MSPIRSTRCLPTRRLVQTLQPNPSRTPEAPRVATAAAVAPTLQPCCSRRSFHTTPRQAKQQRFSSVHAEKIGLITPEKIQEYTDTYFPPFDELDYRALSRHYTPKQIAAIRAGEKSIDPNDLTTQGRFRKDLYRMPYFDDFATFQPSIDRRPPEEEVVHPDPRHRFMTQGQFDRDFEEWLAGFIPPEVQKTLDGDPYNPDVPVPTGKHRHRLLAKHAPSAQDILKFWTERSTLMGGSSAHKTTGSAMALALPRKVPGVAGLYGKRQELGGVTADEDDPKSQIKTPAESVHGWTEEALKHVRLRIIETKRVANQTRLGKVHSMRYTVIAGNGDGWLGMAIVKGIDDNIILLKAQALAVLNMIPVRRYEDRTIYGNTRGKISGTVVDLFARPPGFGLRIPHNIFHILNMAGFKDLSARMPRNTNPMNTVKAVFLALKNQRDPEAIAIGRGRKLVDARKVYYGGNVY